jgi:hypothetical protein
LLRRKTGILDNPTHRERVHGVVPWDGHYPPAVGHHDVLTLPRYVEANLFDCANGPEVRDPGYLRYALGGDLHFPHILLTGQLSSDFDVFANRALNVRQSLVFSGALRPASGETRAGDAVPLFGCHQSN